MTLNQQKPPFVGCASEIRILTNNRWFSSWEIRDWVRIARSKQLRLAFGDILYPGAGIGVV